MTNQPEPPAQPEHNPNQPLLTQLKTLHHTYINHIHKTLPHVNAQPIIDGKRLYHHQQLHTLYTITTWPNDPNKPHTTTEQEWLNKYPQSKTLIQRHERDDRIERQTTHDDNPGRSVLEREAFQDWFIKEYDRLSASIVAAVIMKRVASRLQNGRKANLIDKMRLTPTLFDDIGELILYYGSDGGVRVHGYGQLLADVDRLIDEVVHAVSVVVYGRDRWLTRRLLANGLTIGDTANTADDVADDTADDIADDIK